MDLKNFDIKTQWPVVGLSALVVILAILLVGRGSAEANGEAVLGTAQSIAETMVAVQMTGLAEQASPTPTAAPTETARPTRQPTPSPLPGGGACLSASLADETIPDDTVLSPGENFTKAWLLTNTGTCTWTEDYALVFHHGDSMNALQYTPLDGWVVPGESVYLALDMVAPYEPGGHIGFWSIQTPDGYYFGPSSVDTFWVRVSIPGPTPTSRERQVAVSVGGHVTSDKGTGSARISGDDAQNRGLQAILTYNFGNLSDASTVTSVVLQMSPDFTVNGDPFGSLGCLNVYLSYAGALDGSDYNATSSGPLWSFCSVGDLSGGATFGGSAAINAVQSALSANQMQLSFQFENQTDTDGIPDSLRIDPVLKIYWY
ncbi:MAG: hypothetical protein DWG76_04365 [Chloroflexi bacterium]|nr:hypothetical protein [Chloroflexota bacterium]